MGEPSLSRKVAIVQNGLFEVHADGEIYRNTKQGRKNVNNSACRVTRSI